MKKDSIALIGFMATGKSVVGKALAKQLGNEFKFVETDDIVIKLAGKSIPEIFSEDGEAVFRRFEFEACKKVSNLNKIVISCGGGIVLNNVNIEILRGCCNIVLLTASIEEIYNRILTDGINTRPLINTNSPLEEIRRILTYRQPFYDSAADIVIDTTGKSLKRVVKLILDKIIELNLY